MNTAQAPCPCGLPARYGACCGRWHAGALWLCAPDAGALMRSRYSAFVLRHADYLLATWHPNTRPGSVEFDSAQRWTGLELKHVAVQDADHAEVEFVARYKLRGHKQVLHEISRFERMNARWLYLDGQARG